MSSNLIADLTQVNLIKQNIKNAIINKGQTVTNFLSYPGAIENIQSGGDGDIALYENISEMQANTANEGDLALVYSTNNLQALWQYTNNSWELAPTGLIANREYVNSAKFWGANGIETGVLQVNSNLTTEQVKIKAQVFNNLSYLELDPSVTSLANAFYSRVSFQASLKVVPNFNTSNITNMLYMFTGQSNLISVPNFDTSKVVNMRAMFSGCRNLTVVPNFNFNNATSIMEFYRQCHNLTNISDIYAPKVTNLYALFTDCSRLVNSPNITAPNVTSISWLFTGCHNLVNIGSININSIKNADYAFSECTNIVDVQSINLSQAVNLEGTFRNCVNLSDASIAHIVNSLPNANQLVNQYIVSIGLNLARFDDDQLRILNNKGYIDAIPKPVGLTYNITYTI